MNTEDMIVELRRFYKKYKDVMDRLEEFNN